MKKNLLITTLFVLAVSGMSYSQCTVDPQYTNSGLWPDPVTGIKSGMIGYDYKQNFTVVIPADTFLGVGTATINYTTITGINFVPSGLGLIIACSPADCIYPCDTIACMEVTWIPAAFGTFTMTFTFIANVIGITPVSQSII